MLTEHVLTLPLAERLSSLAGIRADLQQAKAYCERLIERYAGEHLKESPFDIVGFTTHMDFLEWEALSSAACVAYARCFISGVRQTLKEEDLDKAEPELKVLHDYILNLRNKHIAHSVNSFEVNAVTVQLHTKMTEAKEISTVLPRSERSGALIIGHPAKFLRLLDWWLTHTHSELLDEIDSVLAAVRTMELVRLRQLPIKQSQSYEERESAVAKRRPQA